MSDLFENEKAPDQGDDTVSFDTLVGEGKKFKDPDALARAKAESDKFIEQLQTEMSELRTELKSRQTLEEMMTKITPQRQVTTPPQTNADTTRQEPEDDKLRQDIDLSAEVRKLLMAEKEKDKRESNITKVRNELRNRFGADYNQDLARIAETLEVSKEFLTQMASTSPAGFLKLVDSVAPADRNTPSTPPRGAVDTSKNVFTNQPKNAEYYRKLRRENQVLYFSPKVQNEMFKERERQGDNFYK